MTRIVKAVFLYLICSFFSFLLLYYWSPMLPYNLQTRIPSDSTEGLISSIPFIFIAEFFFSKEFVFVVGRLIAIISVNLMCTVIIWIPLSHHFLSLYYRNPLPSHNLQTRIPRLIEHLISSIPFIFIAEISFSKESLLVVSVVIAILSVHLMLTVIIMILLTSRSNTIYFFMVPLTTILICMSRWISGYIYPASFLFLCTYTVIAMVLIQTTKERPFKANPTEFKQGKLKSIYYNKYTDFFYCHRENFHFTTFGKWMV